MKILHIISAGYKAGGAENILFQTKNHFEKKGHTVKIMSSNLKSEIPHFSDYEFSSISNSFFSILYFGFNPFSFFKLQKILRVYKPDIVHLHTMHQVSPSVLFLLKKTPTVMTIHGPESFLESFALWYLPATDFKNREYNAQNLNIIGRLHLVYFKYVVRNIYKLVIDRINLFIVPSRYMQKTVSYEISPIQIINNPLPSKKKYLKNNIDKNILYIGRLEKTKGVEYLIKSMPLIVKQKPNIILYIVGDGKEKNYLKLLSKRLKVSKNIKFVGWIDNDDIHKYYINSIIAVIPSIWPENFPTVCLEAISFGLPVIASNVGGIPEIIEHGKNGYIIDPKNTDQIAEKVIKLLKNEELRKQMSQAAIKKSNFYNMDKYITDIEKIYKQLLYKK